MGDVLKQMAERAGAGRVLAVVLAGVALVSASLSAIVVTTVGLPERVQTLEAATRRLEASDTRLLCAVDLSTRDGIAVWDAWLSPQCRAITDNAGEDE